MGKIYACNVHIKPKITATETLVDTMQSFHIPRLIFLGDAYSMLASGDNYGLSEYMHESMPNNFMLGIYGESKARAEFVIRKATQTGNFIIFTSNFHVITQQSLALKDPVFTTIVDVRNKCE